MSRVERGFANFTTVKLAGVNKQPHGAGSSGGPKLTEAVLARASAADTAQQSGDRPSVHHLISHQPTPARVKLQEAMPGRNSSGAIAARPAMEPQPTLVPQTLGMATRPPPVVVPSPGEEHQPEACENPAMYTSELHVSATAGAACEGARAEGGCVLSPGVKGVKAGGGGAKGGGGVRSKLVPRARRGTSPREQHTRQAEGETVEGGRGSRAAAGRIGGGKASRARVVKGGTAREGCKSPAGPARAAPAKSGTPSLLARARSRLGGSPAKAVVKQGQHERGSVTPARCHTSAATASLMEADAAAVRSPLRFLSSVSPTTPRGSARQGYGRALEPSAHEPGVTTESHLQARSPLKYMRDWIASYSVEHGSSGQQSPTKMVAVERLHPRSEDRPEDRHQQVRAYAD